MKENDMNLYIINEVLYDYTDGMCVIAAPSLERCRELFIEQFGDYNNIQSDAFDKAVQSDWTLKVIEGVNYPEGVVSYVYGGG